jgi:hypothetical protein
MNLPPLVTGAAYQAAHMLLNDVQTRLSEALKRDAIPDDLFWARINHDIEHVRRLLGGEE